MKKTWFYNIWESRFNGGSSLWLCVIVVFYLWTCRTSVLTQPRSCTIGKTSFTVQLPLCIVSTINSATRLVKQKKNPQHCTYKINQANQTLKITHKIISLKSTNISSQSKTLFPGHKHQSIIFCFSEMLIFFQNHLICYTIWL